MERYEALIHVDPMGKQRPRMTKTGHTYTPVKTVEFEGLIRQLWMLQTNNAKGTGCYISAIINAGFRIPKSWSKKRRAAAVGMPHTSKPDADNVAKAVLDALNGTAYDDDSHVTELHITKVYAERPYVEIILMYHTPEEAQRNLEALKEASRE